MTSTTTSKPTSVTVDHRDVTVTATAHRPPTTRNPHWAWRAQYKRKNIFSGRLPRGEVSAAVSAAIDALLAKEVEKVEEVEEVEEVEPRTGDLLDTWLAAREKDADGNSGTKRSDRDAVEALFKVCATTPVSEAFDGRGVGVGVIKDALRRSYAPSTTWLYLSKLRAVFNWSLIHNAGLRTASRKAAEAEDGLALKFIMPPKYKGRRALVTKEAVYNNRMPTAREFLAVVDALAAERVTDRKGGKKPRKDGRAWQAVIYLCGATGMRISEVGNLLWENVDLETGQICIHVEEGNKTGERHVALPADARGWWLPRLEEAKARANGARSERVFGFLPGAFASNARNRLTKACLAAGVPRFALKGLRVMVSNLLFDNGADPAVEAAVMGHSEQTAALHYRRASRQRQADVLAAATSGMVPGIADAPDNVIPFAR